MRQAGKQGGGREILEREKERERERALALHDRLVPNYAELMQNNGS